MMAGVLRVAGRAARAIDPLAVLALFAVHLAFAGGLWAAAAWSLGGPLANRPAPDLFTWITLGLSHPDGMHRLLVASAVVGALYLLGGSFLAGALLARLAGQPGALRAGLRRLGRLLLLRLASLALVSVIVMGAASALPWVFRRSLGLADERAQALLLLGAALPALLAALVCALLLHYGQALIVLGRPLRALPGETLALIHRRPLGTSGLYLGGWLVWSAITLLGLLGLPGLVAALLRVTAHVWSYAAALGAVRAWVPDQTSAVSSSSRSSGGSKISGMG